MFKNKTKGNIAWVLILIVFITTGAILIYDLPFNDLKAITNNKEYLQYLIDMESIKEVFIVETIKSFKDKEYILDRDSEIIDELIVYGDYYLPSNQVIPKINNEVIENNIYVKDKLEIDTISISEYEIPEHISNTNIYDFPYNNEIIIKTKINVIKGEFNQSFNLEFKVAYTITRAGEKGIISDVKILDEYFYM